MITIIKWLSLLCEVIFTAVMLFSSPARATTYEYTIDFKLVGLNPSGTDTVKGTIQTSCDFCELTASEILSWDFSISGATNLMLSSSVDAQLTVSGNAPLMALPTALVYDSNISVPGKDVFLDLIPNSTAGAELDFYVPIQGTIGGIILYGATPGGFRNHLPLLSLIASSASTNNVIGSDQPYVIGDLADSPEKNPPKIRELRREVRELEVTPLPAALPLFAGGLGIIGLLGRRRKRENARTIGSVKTLSRLP
jgi:hypothetical protein